MALAEASFGGIGADVRLASSMRPELLLFHEGPSRILISTAEPERARAIASEFGIEAPEIGVTIESRVRIQGFVDCEVTQLKRPWEGALEKALHG